MIAVLVMAAAIWLLGAAFKTPKRARFNLLGLFYAGLIALHLILPAAHPLRLATGETVAPWALLGGAIAIVIAYRAALERLRQRSAAPEAKAEPSTKSAMGEVELARYARHIMLREIGGTGQNALNKARILVVGAGGLGAPALQYLAAAGVGTLGVIDADAVEGSNLQRQVIHTDARIGMPKVFSAQEAIVALNPFVAVRPYHRKLTPEIAADLLTEYDLVLDGTDNFETRYAVNSTCVAAGIPLISGALSQWEGQVSVFDPANGSPCYQCIFPEAPAEGLAPSCAEAGVLGPLPGVVGAMMAVEAIKLITKAGTSLRGEMILYDALYGETRKIAISRRIDCPVCQGT